MINSPFFSKKDTSLYKGLAILFIVVHNYFHWQKGFGIENEEKFNEESLYFFLNNLYPQNWFDPFVSLFSYLGHYGVQLFIFFSAYGLSIQLIHSKTKFNYLDYLFKRLKKLYFLLVFGVVLFLVFFYIVNNHFYSLRLLIRNFLLLSTSFSNFSKYYLYKMFVGPFWFFGLMIQLYIVFPLLLNLVKKYNILVVYAITFALIYLLYYIDLTSNFSLFGTILGHMPEVLLGIYFATNSSKKITFYTFIISLTIFILSQLSIYFFPLGFVSVTLIIVYLIEFIKKYLSQFWISVLIYFGEISMILFIVNGFFRLLPLFNINDMLLRAERIFLYLLLLFITSHLIYKLYNYLILKLKI